LIGELGYGLTRRIGKTEIYIRLSAETNREPTGVQENSRRRRNMVLAGLPVVESVAGRRDYV